jgi:hypothetical protein
MNGPFIAYRANMGVQTSAPFANTKSLQFDGIDDFVSCGNITELDNVTSATWSIWSNSLITTSYHYLLSCYSTGFKQYLFKQSTNKLDIFLSDSSGTLRLCNTINFTFTVGVWFHVTIIYDETEPINSDKVKVYIDGVLQSNTVAGFALTSLYVSNGLATEIGKAGGFTSNQYNGNLDEICILDRVVTPTEIVTLSTAPTVDLTDLNPIAWYRNGDNGSYKSPQWLIPNNENKDKVSNYSFELDGTDDYINTGASTLSGETALTISAWVYPTAYGDATAPSFVSTDEASPRAFYLGLYTSTNFRFSLSTNGANLNSLDTAAGTVDLNTWQHILVTWDKVNTKFYKNGVLLKTVATTFANNQNFTTTNNLLIGARRSSAGFFNGNIDEVSVWNSVQDASTIYNSGTPTTISGAVSNWKMGEDATFSGGVWTVPDAVGSNDGTSANMTIEDRIGEAPNSTNNALSLNMDEVDRTTDVPT